MFRPGEEDALNATKLKVAEKRESILGWMRELDRMDEAGLASCGYRKGKEDAIYRAFKNGQKEIDKLWADFVKQFPDN